MAKVSVILPARNEQYLWRTVEDIYAKATGDIEVLVLLDGWMPERRLIPHEGLVPIYVSESYGMRRSLNYLAQAATGKYLLKLDAHCMVGESFDEILQRDMEDDWLVTPSRYSLDAENWDRRGEPVEYLYVTFPYIADDMYGAGFHGKKWIGADGIGENMGKQQYYFLERARKHVPIDDISIIQGSCWFMTKDMFKRIDMLDERHHFFFQEGNELCFKVWLSGGRCVVNKNTWYAHYHKREPSGYGMSMGMKRETQRFSTWVWMNDKWPKATKKMDWFINNKFYPMPSWPSNWQSYVKDDSDFRVFDEHANDGFKLNGPDKHGDSPQVPHQAETGSPAA